MALSFTETINSQTIDLDLTKIESQRENLTKLCTDIFIIVIRMRESEDLGDPAALRKLIFHYLKLFKSNCRTLKYSNTVISNAVYALVAILDETVLSVPGECRNFWITNPLQLELYGDNIAGEEFYLRLEKLVREAQKMRDVIEIYYLCLSIGFEGKYKLGNAQERDVVIDKIARILLKTSKRTLSGLSPHGRRTLPRALRKNKNPKIIPYWIIAIIMTLATIFWWWYMNNLTEISMNTVLSIMQ